MGMHQPPLPRMGQAPTLLNLLEARALPGCEGAFRDRTTGQVVLPTLPRGLVAANDILGLIACSQAHREVERANLEKVLELIDDGSHTSARGLIALLKDNPDRAQLRALRPSEITFLNEQAAQFANGALKIGALTRHIADESLIGNTRVVNLSGEEALIQLRVIFIQDFTHALRRALPETSPDHLNQLIRAMTALLIVGTEEELASKSSRGGAKESILAQFYPHLISWEVEPFASDALSHAGDKSSNEHDALGRTIECLRGYLVRNSIQTSGADTFDAVSVNLDTSARDALSPHFDLAIRRAVAEVPKRQRERSAIADAQSLLTMGSKNEFDTSALLGNYSVVFNRLMTRKTYESAKLHGGMASLHFGPCPVSYVRASPEHNLSDLTRALLIFNAERILINGNLPIDSVLTEERSALDALRITHHTERVLWGTNAKPGLDVIGSIRDPLRWELEALGATEIREQRISPKIIEISFMWSHSGHERDLRSRTILYSDISEANFNGDPISGSALDGYYDATLQRVRDEVQGERLVVCETVDGLGTGEHHEKLAQLRAESHAMLTLPDPATLKPGEPVNIGKLTPNTAKLEARKRATLEAIEFSKAAEREAELQKRLAIVKNIALSPAERLATALLIIPPALKSDNLPLALEVASQVVGLPRGTDSGANDDFRNISLAIFRSARFEKYLETTLDEPDSTLIEQLWIGARDLTTDKGALTDLNNRAFRYAGQLAGNGHYDLALRLLRGAGDVSRLPEDSELHLAFANKPGAEGFFSKIAKMLRNQRLEREQERTQRELDRANRERQAGLETALSDTSNAALTQWLTANGYMTLDQVSLPSGLVLDEGGLERIALCHRAFRDEAFNKVTGCVEVIKQKKRDQIIDTQTSRDLLELGRLSGRLGEALCIWQEAFNLRIGKLDNAARTGQVLPQSPNSTPGSDFEWLASNLDGVLVAISERGDELRNLPHTLLRGIAYAQNRERLAALEGAMRIAVFRQQVQSDPTNYDAIIRTLSSALEVGSPLIHPSLSGNSEIVAAFEGAIRARDEGLAEIKRQAAERIELDDAIAKIGALMNGEIRDVRAIPPVIAALNLLVGRGITEVTIPIHGAVLISDVRGFIEVIEVIERAKAA